MSGTEHKKAAKQVAKKWVAKKSRVHGPSKTGSSSALSSSAWSAVLAKAEENEKNVKESKAITKALHEDVLQGLMCCNCIQGLKELPYQRA